MIHRRTFLTGLTSILAPAVIRTPGLLMPVRSIVPILAINTDTEWGMQESAFMECMQKRYIYLSSKPIKDSLWVIDWGSPNPRELFPGDTDA